VPDERVGVRIAFYAVAFHQDYAVLDRFAETVPAIGGNRHMRIRKVSRPPPSTPEGPA
jgi:hypothetical protein